jgi:hypothetical protein
VIVREVLLILHESSHSFWLHHLRIQVNTLHWESWPINIYVWECLVHSHSNKSQSGSQLMRRSYLFLKDELIVVQMIDLLSSIVKFNECGWDISRIEVIRVFIFTVWYSEVCGWSSFLIRILDHSNNFIHTYANDNYHLS